MQCSYDHTTESSKLQFQRCSGCSVTCYCSRKCQRAHWKDGHADECKKGAVCALGKSLLQLVICVILTIHAVGCPPPIKQSNLDHQHIQTRILLDANTTCKDQLEALVASHRRDCLADVNPANYPKVYVALDYTRHPEPHLYIAGKELLTPEVVAWMENESASTCLLGVIGGNGALGGKPEVYYQVLQPFYK